MRDYEAEYEAENPGLFPLRDLGIVPNDSIPVLGVDGETIRLQSTTLTEPAIFIESDDEGNETEIGYEYLFLQDGSRLGPARYLVYWENELRELAARFEVVHDSPEGPLLREIIAEPELSTLEILNALDEEDSEAAVKRIKDARRLQAAANNMWVDNVFPITHVSHYWRVPEYWLRFEPDPAAEPHLQGKIILARLAILVPQEDSAIVVPMIYDSLTHFADIHEIPKQLVLANPWLYVKLLSDEEAAEL